MRRLITLVAILFAGGTARATDSSSADTTTAPAIIGNTSTAIYSMPTTCEKDGRTYREGETWNRGHLRYKCAKYGVYSIEGCRTDKDRELQIGESFVDENVVHQCYTRDGAVYYRQAVCGIYGQPACEDMKDPTKFMMPTAPTQVRTVNIPQNPASGLPQLAGLPEGWRIVDKNGNPIPISDIRITTHTVYLPANPQGGRRKRHILFGSSVPASGVNSRGQNNDGEGSDSSSTANGENKSTVERRMAATHSNTESGSRSDAEWRRKAIGLKAGDIEDRPEAFISGISKTDTFVDPAGATLRSWRIRRQVGVGSFVPVGVDDPRDNRKHAPPSGGSAGTSMGGGRVAGVGTGSVDLHHRSKTISVNTTGLRPGSIGGSQSSTAWKGRTLHIGGKEVAVGPGTFTFGTSPTGAFVRPAGGHHALRRVRRQMGVGSFVPIGVDDPRDNRKHMPLGGSGSSMSVSDRKVAGVGTGSVDLHHRSKTVSANMTSLRPESISGNRSDTAWKGRTLHIGGKEVAVGPGTFTFGTSPTGAFVRPAGGHHALRVPALPGRQRVAEKWLVSEQAQWTCTTVVKQFLLTRRVSGPERSVAVEVTLNGRAKLFKLMEGNSLLVLELSPLGLLPQELPCIERVVMLPNQWAEVEVTSHGGVKLFVSTEKTSPPALGPTIFLLLRSVLLYAMDWNCGINTKPHKWDRQKNSSLDVYMTRSPTQLLTLAIDRVQTHM
uniref:Secreted protein n=1 Tax=Steinernema glaseri TaxID=37863 RepID=A0A1I7Z9A6_9BILA